MAGESILGTAQIPIRATLDELDRDLADARGKVEGAFGAVQNLGKIALGGLAAGATIAAAAIGGLAAAAVTGYDSLLNWQGQVHGLEKVLGGTGEQMSAWATAMHHVGLTTEEGAMGLNYFTRQLDNVTALTKKGAPTQNAFTDALNKLGIATKDSSGKLRDFNSLMPDIMDKFKAMPEGITSSALAMDMFGARGGSRFLEFLRLGSSGLADADSLAKKFGLSLSTEGIDSIESTNRAMNDLNLVFTGFKNQVGMAVLPVVASLVSSFMPLVGAVLPKFKEVLARVAPIAKTVADSFAGFISSILGGTSPLTAFQTLLSKLLPPAMVKTIMGIVTSVQSFLKSIKPTIDQVMAWVSKNVQLKDVLTALGIAIASVVIPAILGVVAGVAPIIAAFVALVAIVTLVRNVWDTNWGGIRTTLTEFWTGTAQPALTELWTWLQVNIPVAIQTLSTFWTGTLLPAIQTAWAFIQTSVLPMLAELWAWLSVNVPVAIQTLSNFWTGTLVPALTAVWSFIQGSVIPTLAEIWNWLAMNIPPAIQLLANYWNTVLYPALQLIWSFIQANVLPLFSLLWTWLSVTLTGAIQVLTDYWNTVLYPAIVMIWDFISNSIIPLFQALADLLITVVGAAVSALATLWTTVYLPAIRAIWDFIDKNLIPIFKTVADVVVNVLGKAFLWVKDNVILPFKGALDEIAHGIAFLIGMIDDAIAAMNKLSGKVSNSPVMGHSPSPLELSLRGISAAMSDLSRMTMPQLTVGFERMQSTELVSRGGGQTGPAGGQHVAIYGLTLNGVQNAGELLTQLQAVA